MRKFSGVIEHKRRFTGYILRDGVVPIVPPDEPNKPSGEPVAYLYNGVRLPKIPAVEGFDFQVIAQMDYLGIDDYIFYAFKNPYVTHSVHSEAVTGVYNEDTGEWVYVRQGEYYPNMAHHKYIWANHDIADATGVPGISASEPVPIYE